MFSCSLGWECFTQPLTRGYFKPFQCTQTYDLAPDGLGLIIVYDGVLCFHLSRLIRHREWNRCCSVACHHHTQLLCLSLWLGHEGKEFWGKYHCLGDLSECWLRAHCLHIELICHDTERVCLHFWCASTASFQALPCPFPLVPYLDKLIRKPGAPASALMGSSNKCNPRAVCTGAFTQAPAHNHNINQSYLPQQLGCQCC